MDIVCVGLSVYSNDILAEITKVGMWITRVLKSWWCHFLAKQNQQSERLTFLATTQVGHLHPRQHGTQSRMAPVMIGVVTRHFGWFALRSRSSSFVFPSPTDPSHSVSQSVPSSFFPPDNSHLRGREAG